VTAMSAPPIDLADIRLDVAGLRRLLDEPYTEVREETRARMVRLGVQPPETLSVLPHEEYRELVLEWARQLAADGGTGLGFPTEYGGGGDVGGSIAAFETLGIGNLSLLVKCGVQFGLFGGAVLHLGTRHHHEKYLPDIITMDLPGCFAMTETGHGSNVQELETTTTYDPDADQLVVHTPTVSGRKDYIGNAARDGRMAVVFTQLVVGGESRGVHAVLVPIRDAAGRARPGVTIEDCGPKTGLNGVDNGRLSFDEVRVPRQALLDRFAEITDDGEYFSRIENPDKRFFTMLGTLVQGRISISGAGISASKLALVIAVRYAERRRQFGPPDEEGEAVLFDYRAHRRRLLPRLARIYALHAAQQGLIDGLHEAFGDFSEEEEPGRDRRELEAAAAGIKAASTWHTTDTVQECREACGGAGYLAENRFAALKADTDIFTTFEGDNTVLLQLVAKGLLTDYRDEFGDLDPLGMARFVADQVFETVVEKTSARQLVERLIDAVPTRDDDAGLLDREYQLELFRWREEHVVAGVARRLKRGIDDGQDPFEVFTDAQDHVLTAARVHIERLLLEAFDGLVRRCEDPELAEVLDRLCSLHALAEVERDRGWFQEHGRLSGERSKSIIATVNRLCDELRPHAVDLVDGFGIPDELVSAPIAFGH
jgi:acyl-CoA oxidase